MTNPLVWKGDDKNGYIGRAGNQIYSVTPFQVLRRDQEGNLQPNHIVYWMRFLDIDRARTDPEYHADYGEHLEPPGLPIRVADEAKALCEADYIARHAQVDADNVAPASAMSLDEALTVVKAAGYRVSKPNSKPKSPKPKDRVGPTFVARFADGETIRMTTFTSLEQLDWDRGTRLSQAAYQSRWRTRSNRRNQTGLYGRARQFPVRGAAWEASTFDLITPIPPAIVSAHFEQDGKVLAQLEQGR
jgi:hypothetical protein